MSHLRVFLSLCIFSQALVHAASERSYEVYQPSISHHVILDFNEAGIKYRHVAAIEYFKGKYFATWNANSVFSEAKPGQVCYVASSDDGKNWGEPFRLTPDTNIPGGKYDVANIQWQGGLFNYNDEELWFFWSEEPNSALHMSVLREPDGQWEDRIIQGAYEVDGVDYMAFACNNPIELANGRIMLPIIVQDFASYAYNVNPVKWHGIPKFAVALVSDDAGKTWHVEPDTLQSDPPEFSGAHKFNGVWEPMYVVQADGKVRAFARTAGNRLVTALGDTKGETMGPWEDSATRTLNSRHWVGQYGDRRIMVHHDDYREDVNWRDRRNLALFFSRSGEDDFAAGNSVAGRDYNVQYPQALVHNDTLHVAYTKEAGHELINTIVDPLPEEGLYYVFPRGDRRGIIDEEIAHPETEVEIFQQNGREILRFKGNASAGVDVDIFDPSKDSLAISFPLFIENWEHLPRMTFLTVGDGQIRLGWSKQNPDVLQICIDGKWQDSVPIKTETWQDVHVEINKEGIAVSVECEQMQHLAASAFSSRVYLGDGYPEKKLYTQSRFLVDISGLHTRVTAK